MQCELRAAAPLFIAAFARSMEMAAVARVFTVVMEWRRLKVGAAAVCWNDDAIATGWAVAAVAW